MRLIALIIISHFLLFHGTPVTQAAEITPDLHTKLRNSGPDEEFSVIIKLSDQPSISHIKEAKKGLRRARIVDHLRNHANSKQVPLKKFLEKRKAGNVKSLWIINGLAVTARADVIRELANQPEIMSLQLDQITRVPAVTYSATSISEWNLEAIHVKELWNLGYTGQGVVIASMDSGVDLNHPDLINSWRGGTNSWFDPYKPPDQQTLPYDPRGHGTQTMGIMVGGNSSGTAIGLAPGAKWIAVKIFDDPPKTSTLSAIHEGYQWLLNPGGQPDDAPDIVNNSWDLENSSNVCVTEFQTDIQLLRAAGIAVVFAGGNDSPMGSGYPSSVSPANNPGSFPIGIIDQSLKISSFSNYGPSACDGSIYPALVAPGVDVYTSDLTFGLPYPLNQTYTTVSGSSFAAPHTSGAMALILSAFPTIKVAELEMALKRSAGDLGIPGQDNVYGFGLLNVLGAYTTLITGEINNDGVVGIDDAILALRVASGSSSSGIRPNYPASGADVNGDNKIGLAEVIYILQKTSGLR